jgi:hypothetical protein
MSERARREAFVMPRGDGVSKDRTIPTDQENSRYLRAGQNLAGHLGAGDEQNGMALARSYAAARPHASMAATTSGSEDWLNARTHR